MTGQVAKTPVGAFVIMALGAAGLTLGDFFIKIALSSGVTLATLFVFAWPLTCLGLVAMAHISGGIAQHLTPKHPRPLMIRAVLLLITSWLNITSLSFNTYAEHAILFQLSPVFALGLGIVFLGGKLTLRTALVFALCLIGAWLVLQLGTSQGSVTLLFAVGAAFMNAVTNSYIGSHKWAATALGFTFYAFNGVFLVMAAYWTMAERLLPDLAGLMWIQFSALFGVAGMAFVGRAFLLAHKNISTLGTMLYVQIPIAVVLGALVFDTLPPVYTIIGSLFIVAGGIVLSQRR
jgi:drug/metabolite transporter (DMT)-like permease